MNNDVGDEQKDIIMKLNMENLMYDGTDPAVMSIVQYGEEIKGYNYQKLLRLSGPACPTDALDIELSVLNVGGGPEKGMCTTRFNSVHHNLSTDNLHSIFDAIPRDGQELCEGKDAENADKAMGKLDFIKQCLSNDVWGVQ